MVKKPSKAVQAYQWLWLTILNKQTPAQFWLPIRQLVRAKNKTLIHQQGSSGIVTLRNSYHISKESVHSYRFELCYKHYLMRIDIAPAGYQAIKKQVMDWLKDIALVVQKQVDAL